jgi:serine/threonine protein phosphatase PrpC
MAKLAYAGLTDVGMKRTHNEDNFRLLPEHNCFVVCDGMGGHASGEVASEIAVETIGDFFIESGSDDEITWPYKEERDRPYIENLLVNSVRYANLRVFEKASADAQYKGMGTTFVGMTFADDRYYVAHVGDSRCYLIRNREIEQLTEDHSLLNDYKKMAKLTPEEERNFPHKNIIVRALGMKDTVLVDVGSEPFQKGDIYLLCSDGLSGELEDPVILALALENWDDLETMCTELVRQTNENGGKDNVTVVVVKVME